MGEAARLRRSPLPATPPSPRAPRAQVLHEVLQLAFLQEPPEGDDYHELQRFARSHHPLSLHPSWGEI